MTDLNNKNLEKLIIKSINENNCSVLNNITYELMDSLSNATFYCPFTNGMVIPLELGEIHMLPVFTSLNEYEKLYDDFEYKTFKFNELSKELKFFMNGIIINPTTIPFIIDKKLANMVFYKIKDDEKEPVCKGYDVKVRLKDFKPNTWKDLIIPENITFMELDDILKTIWDFNGSHMSAFITKKGRHMIMDGDLSRETMMDGDYDANFTLINDFFEDNEKITYWYDFTDDWKFDIEIKKKIDYDKKYVTIKRFKGKYNLLDDCGGPFEYGEILDMAEKSTEDDLDDYLEEFDMEECQEMLKRKNYVYSTWYESPI